MDEYPINRIISKMGVESVGYAICPAKGVKVKSPSRVRIPLSPPPGSWEEIKDGDAIEGEGCLPKPRAGSTEVSCH